MTLLADLETPHLVLDRAKLTANISRMNARARELIVPLRPHLKTAKSVEVARLAVDPSAPMIAVSTLLEAEYFAAAGYKDILYASPLTPDKVARAARLLRQGVDLICATHDVHGAQLMAARAAEEKVRIPFLIDVDIDHYRSGVETRDPAFMALAKAIHEDPALALRGIMIYGGASYDLPSTDAMAALTESIRLGGLEARGKLIAAGYPCPIVSYGSSPGTYFARSMEGITESRAGVYMFQDVFQAGIGACAIEDIALSVATSITGKKPLQNRLLVDAGGLALSKDVSTNGHAFDAGYGLVCDLANGAPIGDLIVQSVSQEVGMITSRSGSPIDMSRFAVGSKLRILPNLACFTAAAHAHYHVVEGDDCVLARWDRVNGW